MGLAARARRLIAVRHLGADRVTGLVWCHRDEASPVFDASALPEGAVVVRDYTVSRYRVDDASDATWCERLAAGPDDHGDVFAWDGSLVGRARPAVAGGVLLPITWPPGLAFEDPAAGAAAADDGDGARLVAARDRSAEEARVSAELAEVDRLRKAQL